VIVVEGVERWREADVERQLSGAIGSMPPETTLACFAREEGAGEGSGGPPRGGSSAPAGRSWRR